MSSFKQSSTRWNENVLIFDGPLQELLNSPQGPVAVVLGQRAQRGVNAAKQNASGRPGPNVVTGRLRSSISWELGRDGVGLFADFGTNLIYGYYLETGLRNGAKYPFLIPAMSAI